MGEPLPPPQQQCAAPLPNGPEEEALHLDHPNPASTQPPMQTSADAAAASTHADCQSAPPVFWTTRHLRTASYHSISHLGPGTIQLEDHSEEQHEQSQGCWARSVTVDDYTVVSGPSGIGSFVTWHLTVSTLKGGDMSIRKRYVLLLLLFSSRLISYHVHTIRTFSMSYASVDGPSTCLALISHSCTLDAVATKQFGSDVADIISRYSEFDRLRENLVRSFPHAEGSIPQLPRKSVVSRFRPRFLEQRKNGLSHFIKYVSKRVC